MESRQVNGSGITSRSMDVSLMFTVKLIVACLLTCGAVGMKLHLATVLREFLSGSGYQFGVNLLDEPPVSSPSPN